MKFVDLFAGCGGLSLGMERAGGELVAAVEKSDMAARTFFHNYVGDAADPRVWDRYVSSPLSEQASSKVIVRPLLDVLEDREVMSVFAAAELDVVVGGPPCQGFSMAGRRNKDDIRNRLAWEYLDFVAFTQPKAVVIENVLGMGNSFERGEESSFSQLRKALSTRGSYGYRVQPVQVNAMHYGAPQHRPRLMLIALRSDIADSLRVTVSEEVWQSAFRDEVASIPNLAPVPTVDRADVWTVRDAIADLTNWDLIPGSDRNLQYLKGLSLFSEVVDRKLGDLAPNQQRRTHGERVTRRFSLYRWMQQAGVDRTILGRIAANPEGAVDIARPFLQDVRYPVVLRSSATDRGVVVADEERLLEIMLQLGTKKHSQKALDPERPARTVVSLPDDYVHPAESRTFTVREMARFQGFPDNFEFLGKETTGAHRRRVEVPQYTQVGNAVSPWQSFAVAKRLKEHLDRYSHAGSAVLAISGDMAQRDRVEALLTTSA
ncbi:cytosine-specific methyltransferase [Sinomonas cyclohexanicum]|uniref:Cytosine-specific methyltransferase n=1 Tax=Sinomonas cyclohexanicum TaxID=322009 RepID=A0ABN6FLH6_SINCY|nr:DNA cytosine methyltransferase [Corynebacterium cyclohexanicum]BCT77661.1 cytosine-specific methyltransferase [Corynebacterium cyclohexanicum]